MKRHMLNSLKCHYTITWLYHCKHINNTSKETWHLLLSPNNFSKKIESVPIAATRCSCKTVTVHWVYLQEAANWLPADQYVQARSGFRVLISDHNDSYKPVSTARGEWFKISLTTTSREHQAGVSPTIMLFSLALKALVILWDLTGMAGGVRLHKWLPHTNNFHLSEWHR